MAPVTTTGPKYGIELNTPARSPQNAGCSNPIHRSASQVVTPTIALVNSCTTRKRSIWSSISRRICSVIFFFSSEGPAIFTSLRR